MKFSTKDDCLNFIIKHGLEAIPAPGHNEEGELLFWFVDYI